MHHVADENETPLAHSHVQIELFERIKASPGPGRERGWLRGLQCVDILPLLLTSWSLFRIGPIPVQFHFTCLIYPVGYLFWLNRDVGWWRNVTEVTIVMALLWGSLLAHEWAHIMAARRLGVGTKLISFLPIGAVAYLRSIPRGAGEFWIALAGPVCSFLLAGIFWLLHLAVPMSHGSWWSEPARWSRFGTILNLAVAVFNLLPCYPMDGGRMFRALLTVMLARFSPRYRTRAHAVASRITVRYLVPGMVVAASVITIFHTHIWIHLVLFPLLWLAAELEYQFIRETM